MKVERLRVEVRVKEPYLLRVLMKPDLGPEQLSGGNSCGVGLGVRGGSRGGHLYVDLKLMILMSN